MKNFNLKLTLKKQTIAKLDENGMSKVVGGGLPKPETTSCRPGQTSHSK